MSRIFKIEYEVLKRYTWYVEIDGDDDAAKARAVDAAEEAGDSMANVVEVDRDLAVVALCARSNVPSGARVVPEPGPPG